MFLFCFPYLEFEMHVSKEIFKLEKQICIIPFQESDIQS